MVANEENKRIRIAIACQGGGSFTAFTAGALKKILKENDEKYEIVSLSGNSGGAMCALLAWYGLLINDREKSIRLLDSFWEDISASTFGDMLLNNWVVWANRLRDFIPTPEISPYYYPPWAQEYLRNILEKHIDFGRIKELMNPSSPDLFVGAVDVLSGEFKTFKNGDISIDVILASAALPELFPAVRIDETMYWDGLFSRNPPLLCTLDANVKPDEIWVIHINPDTIQKYREPISIGEIRNRRNILSGNLSLHQEIDFIRMINNWIRLGYLSGDKFKHVNLRFIQMLYELGKESKMDRSPSFIRCMMDYGEKQAEKLLMGLA
jgi:NTE family protein